MEGKMIKEESVGSPCSPLPPTTPTATGKENRRVGSPLTTSEILTRSRTKVLSRENSGRMSESPKGGSVSGCRSQSPPNTSSVNKSGSSNSSHHGHSFGHQFSSPHSTTTTVSNGSSVPNPPVGSGGGTPSPPGNGASSNNATSSNAGRTPSSSCNSNSSGSGGSSYGLGHGSGRHVVKMKRFLGTLLHFGCDISPEIGDRVKTLVFNLVSGHLSIEEFHHSLQEITSFPLRPFVVPFLRAHLPLLQREISHLARIAKQSPLSYIRGHEHSIIESGSSPGEPCDIFHSEAGDVGHSGKRKATESFYENGEAGEPSYTSTPKRHHGSLFSPSFFISQGSNVSGGEFRDYPYSYPIIHHGHGIHHEGGSSNQTPNAGSAKGPEDEWKNIHVMLNCILSMVEKTKRALGILQNRTFHAEGDGGASWLRRPTFTTVENSDDFKRQAGEMMAQALRATEDRVSEVKRRAEEAVQEVKRQALVELQRAVAAAEARACEAVAAERARIERVIHENRRNTEALLVGAPVDAEVRTGFGAGSAKEANSFQTCWNCGRKAHETCSGCNMARYCSSFCQHKDWENHHAVCGRNGSSSTDRLSGASDSKNSHVQENSNSSPINVSNPSPDNHSSGSN